MKKKLLKYFHRKKMTKSKHKKPREKPCDKHNKELLLYIIDTDVRAPWNTWARAQTKNYVLFSGRQ